MNVIKSPHSRSYRSALGITLPKESHQQLDALSFALSRPRSHVVQDALPAFVATLTEAQQAAFYRALHAREET